MVVRREQQEDYDRVYELVRLAFASAAHSDGTEQDLVAALRRSDAFLPALSLVAEENGSLCGHILFTKNRIGTEVGLTLAPLSVAPDFQNRGVGTALVQEGHRIAKELGYRYCVVLGSERYYPRFGYRPAAQLDIHPSFAVPRENFMAIDLTGENLPLHGMVEYPKEFGI